MNVDYRRLLLRPAGTLGVAVALGLAVTACDYAETSGAPPPNTAPSVPGTESSGPLPSPPSPGASPAVPEPPETREVPESREVPETPGASETPGDSELSETPATSETPEASAQVIDVVDGDTLEVLRPSGSSVTVRVLGIDTPEVYGTTECWGPAASRFARQTLAGMRVRLTEDPTQEATDGYGRALRHVFVNGQSYGVLAAEAGAARSYVHEVAGQQHAAILAAQRRAQTIGAGLWGPPCYGAEQTPAPTSAPPVAPRTGTAPSPPVPEPSTPSTSSPSAPSRDCAPGYTPCVPPSPPDLDCGDPGAEGPITVTGADPHRFDGDDDGIGCEE